MVRFYLPPSVRSRNPGGNVLFLHEFCRKRGKSCNVIYIDCLSGEIRFNIRLSAKKNKASRADHISKDTNRLSATPTHDAYLDNGTDIGLIVGILIIAYSMVLVNIQWFSHYSPHSSRRNSSDTPWTVTCNLDKLIISRIKITDIKFSLGDSPKHKFRVKIILQKKLCFCFFVTFVQLQIEIFIW